MSHAQQPYGSKLTMLSIRAGVPLPESPEAKRLCGDWGGSEAYPLVQHGADLLWRRLVYHAEQSEDHHERKHD